MWKRKCIENSVESLQTLEDFQKFLCELEKNHQQNPKHWQNNTLENYLDGMSLFALDIKGYYQNNVPAVDPSQPSWRLFADILLAGRVYDSD